MCMRVCLCGVVYVVRCVYVCVHENHPFSVRWIIITPWCGGAHASINRDMLKNGLSICGRCSNTHHRKRRNPTVRQSKRVAKEALAPGVGRTVSLVYSLRAYIRYTTAHGMSKATVSPPSHRRPSFCMISLELLNLEWDWKHSIRFGDLSDDVIGILINAV